LRVFWQVPLSQQNLVSTIIIIITIALQPMILTIINSQYHWLQPLDIRRRGCYDLVVDGFMLFVFFSANVRRCLKAANFGSFLPRDAMRHTPFIHYFSVQSVTHPPSTFIVFSLAVSSSHFYSVVKARFL